MRRAVAALLLLAALVAAAGAHDVLAWRSSLAQQHHHTWLPGDPVGSLLALRDDAALRRAVHAYTVARDTPRGYDNGETQARVRSRAEVLLADLGTSQGNELLGVLVARAGRVTGGITAEDRALDAFATAIILDTSNGDAKYNLELLLRRTRATSTRQGAGNGSGSRGRGRRGAGAGTPGRGY
jgi:hypothetical protein